MRDICALSLLLSLAACSPAAEGSSDSPDRVAGGDGSAADQSLDGVGGAGQNSSADAKGDPNDSDAAGAGGDAASENNDATPVDGSGGDDGSDGSSGGSTGGPSLPTDIIPSLIDWKITLPVDEDGNDSAEAANVDARNTSAWEVKDESLIGFEYPPYFTAREGEVFFRAHVAGATTSGSTYPRSELRQRVGGGDGYWSAEDYQYLQTELRVTHLPEEKPEVSMVQIHGPEDEPLRVQYHADIGVYIIWNESNKDTDNALAYSLGEQLRVTVTVDDGDVTTRVENLDRGTEYEKTWTSSDDTGYFKVGCYTQSSLFLSEFKSGYEDEPDDAYGEVAVSSITLTETYP